MVTITKEMIITIHDDLIKIGGQIDGILCEGTIDWVIESINSTPGIHAKSARALLMSRHHPFFDGNKRASFALAATILKMNGYYLDRSDEDEIFEILHKISDATIDCDIEMIELWLKRKSKRWFKARQRTMHDYL